MNNMSHHNNDHHQHHYEPQQQQQQFLQHQGHNHDFDHPEMTPTNMLTTAATTETTMMMSTNGIMDDNGNTMIDKNHHHGLHQQQSSVGSQQRTMMMTTGSMDHMGKMYFHFGYEPIVLFEQWSADTFWSMFFTCLFFFMMAILYELLKAYRRIHSARLIRRVGRRSIVTKSSQMPTMGGTAEEDAAMTAAAAMDSGGEETAGEENPTMKITKFSHPNYGMRASTANNNNNNHDTESGSSSSSCRNHHTITNNNNNNGGGGDGGLTSSINPILPTLIFEGSSTTTTAATIGLPSNNVPLFVRSLQEMFNIWHIYSTLLYMLQVIFAYYLMLAFMLFNVWICLAIILGAALGHFLLAEQNMALPMDNIVEDYCH